MKAVLQRVSAASVSVNGRVIACLDDAVGPAGAKGLLVLLGVEQGDSEKDSTYLAQKSADLRIFPDEQGKMNRSLLEVKGQALVVSQFTLIADWRRGRRPGFTSAARPDEGKHLYLHFVEELKRLGLEVQTGEFGAHMEVSLINDRPVTLILENRFSLANKANQ